MKTVGGGLLHLSPLAAFVVVLAQSITLFLFASEGLEHFLASRGLPTFPLVPVSSSQAVVGAIIGIGLLKGGKGIRYGVLGEISLGWLTTPLVAGVAAFVLLFVVENVFDRHVYRTVSYRIDGAVIEKLETEGIADPGLELLRERTRVNSERLQRDLKRGTGLDAREIRRSWPAAWTASGSRRARSPPCARCRDARMNGAGSCVMPWRRHPPNGARCPRRSSTVSATRNCSRSWSTSSRRSWCGRTSRSPARTASATGPRTPSGPEGARRGCPRPPTAPQHASAPARPGLRRRAPPGPR
jgi:phosphate/sulfate permease